MNKQRGAQFMAFEGGLAQGPHSFSEGGHVMKTGARKLVCFFFLSFKEAEKIPACTRWSRRHTCCYLCAKRGLSRDEEDYKGYFPNCLQKKERKAETLIDNKRSCADAHLSMDKPGNPIKPLGRKENMSLPREGLCWFSWRLEA
ncbi:hypothetical protein KP509_10G014700 [Ceratopteris richardii]|uniref:Uncharacterized protein n=1 Tax=Ceratopteris richardii TaxID=49495 RepID=A0A8T2TTI5_CERRI|nr:hypothetical protein KP509_10G014700 [Ceratopteris richardii]